MIPSGPIPTFERGRQLVDGDKLQKFSDLLGSSQAPVVAHAGGTKAAAFPITSTNVEVGTVATAADSILLPPSYPGLTIRIVNSGAASMQVFGSGTDTINEVATGTGVAQASGVSAIYFCPTAGKWYRILSA